MKKRLSYFLSVAVLVCGLVSLCCTHRTKKNQETESSTSNKDLEKEKAIKLAEEIALKEYGTIIKNELPLKARLIGDSVWIVKGTLRKGADGGTVYIELRKIDNKLLKITHYK